MPNTLIFSQNLTNIATSGDTGTDIVQSFSKDINFSLKFNLNYSLIHKLTSGLTIQYDEIGQYLKVIGNKISNKSTLIIKVHFRKSSNFKVKIGTFKN